MDVVCLYPNIPHGEGIVFLCKLLESKLNKQISSHTLAELGEVVLGNVMFEFDEKTFKQKRETAIRTKFAPPYAIREFWKETNSLVGVYRRYIFSFGSMVNNLYRAI